MTHKNDSTVLAEAMEQVIEHGMDGLSDAGVYNYPDGSTVEIMPNCDFKMSMADGNRARGTVNSISEDGVISMDMIIDTGPAAGTCATVTGSPTSFDMTNVHQCG
jgi:hypothetical protein